MKVPKSLQDGAVIQRPPVELVLPAKPVLFLVDMFHKEDLGEVRKLWQQRCQFSSLKASCSKSIYLVGLWTQHCHNSKSCRHYLRPVDRHKTQKGTCNLLFLIQYKQVHLQQSIFFGWSQSIVQKFFGCQTSWNSPYLFFFPQQVRVMWEAEKKMLV